MLHSIPFKKIIVAGIVAAVMSNASAATFLEQQVRHRPKSSEPGKAQTVELALFRSASIEPRLAAQLDAEALIVEQPAPNEYLQGIVSRLAEHWPHEKFEVRLVLVSAEGCLADSNTHKLLRICTTLLRNADTEAQLAAVIAHELSHIFLRHGSDRERTSGAPRSVETLGYVLAAADMWRNHQRTGNATLSEPARNAVYLTQAAGLIWADLLNPARDRRQEDEADKLGYDLFCAAGYRSADYFGMYKLLADYQVKQTARLDILKSAAMARARRSAPSVGSNELAAAVIGTTVDKVIAGIASGASTHPRVEAREDALKNYVAKAYPRPMELRPNAGEARSIPEALKPFIEADRLALQALDRIDAAEVAEASKLLDDAGRGVTGTHPALQLALAKIQADTGRATEAIATLEATIQSENAPRRAYFQLATVYVSVGNGDAAIGALKRGARRIGRGSGFIPESIAIVRRAGLEDAAAFFAMEGFAAEVHEVNVLPLSASTSGLYEECTKQLGYDVVRRRVFGDRSTVAADSMLTMTKLLLLNSAGLIEHIPARLLKRPQLEMQERNALGRWRGEVYQLFLKYPIELELTSLEQNKIAGSTRAPTIGCSGSITIEGVREGSLILGSANNGSGKWLCESKDVQLHFLPISASSARLEMYYKNGAQPMAVAELRR